MRGRCVLDGAAATSSVEVSFRVNDQARARSAGRSTVVPRVDVKLDPAAELWSLLVPGTHRFTVTLTHGARDTTAGTGAPAAPAGWPPVPSKPFRLVGEDEREPSPSMSGCPGSRAGTVTIGAVARDSGRPGLVDRPVHGGLSRTSGPAPTPVEALAEVHLADWRCPSSARMGYVRGASDRVPEALAARRASADAARPRTLERGDLDRFDAIVVGPRAYETDSALVENNGRLLEYARSGGLVIVQYQQQLLLQRRLRAPIR